MKTPMSRTFVTVLLFSTMVLSAAGAAPQVENQVILPVVFNRVRPPAVYLPAVSRERSTSGQGSLSSTQSTGNTAFQIQNPSSSDATLTISYYDSRDGTRTCSDTVSGLGPFHSTRFDQAADCGEKHASCICNQPSWGGSVVIESTGTAPIAATVNILQGQSAASAYLGFAGDGTADELLLPSIRRDWNGYNTWFSVQNAGASDTTVEVNYYAAGSSTPVKTDVSTVLKPGASYHRSQMTDDTDLGTSWSGAVVVQSTNGRPLAAVVNTASDSQGTLSTHRGHVANGDATTGAVYMPAVRKAFYGLNTGFQIVALNNGTTGTISFYEAAKSVPNATLDVSLGRYEAFDWNMKGNTAYTTGSVPDNWYGMAVIESSGSVVATVQQTGAYAGEHPQSWAYSGVSSRQLGNNVAFPLIAKKHGDNQWGTAFSIVNVGAPSGVQVFYDALQSSGYDSYTTSPIWLDTNGLLICNQTQYPCLDRQLPEGWVGSVTVESGSPLVASCEVKSLGDGGAYDAAYYSSPLP